MRNLKVSMKMLAGFGAVIIAILVLAIIGIVGLSQMNKGSDEQTFLDNASISAYNVASAHYDWLLGLSNAVFLGTEFTGSTDPETCSLGQWKKSDFVTSTDDTEILNKLKDLDEPHRLIHQKAIEIVNALKNGDKETAAQLYTNEVAPRVTETIKFLKEIASKYTTMAGDYSVQNEATETFITIIFIVVTFIALVFSIALGMIITKGIVNPLQRMSKILFQVGRSGNLEMTDAEKNQLEYDGTANDEIGQCANAFKHLIKRLIEVESDLDKIAERNLSANIDSKSDKDAMANAMNTMLGNLNQTFVEISKISNEVADSSRDIADNSLQLAQAATEQTSAVNALTNQIADVAVKTNENTNMAANAAQFGETIKQNAEKGSVQMQQMMEAVREINEASASISKVIKVIDDIAFQTNILALNAAVEAARAGEHGKGFAVVAEEVRNLAAKSAEAAKETGSLIDNSIKKAELGANIANETSASLSEIVDGVNESSKIVSIIASSSEEQTRAIKQIEAGVGQVGEVVGLISRGAEVAANASNVMHNQSEALADYISHYTLK